MTIVIFAFIGSVVSMFVGWLLYSPAPAPQQVHLRVASNGSHVIIGLKVGNEVQFIEVNR